MDSPATDLETQIEVFLEQVKLSAVRAMEDLPGASDAGWLGNDNIVQTILKRSRSDISSSDDGTLHSAEAMWKQTEPNNDGREEDAVNCFLSMSKTPAVEQEVQYWENFPDGEPATIVWKMDGDELVQVPVDYKIEKFLVTQNQNLPNQSAEGEKYVIIQNGPSTSSSSQYANLQTYVSNAAYEEAVVETLEKSDLSCSESVDVDVEESDPQETISNCVVPLPSKTPQPKPLAKGKRKNKRTKRRLNKTQGEKAVVKKGAAKKKADSAGVKVVKPKLEVKYDELTQLEDNAEQVEERFKFGCECPTNCFDGLSAEKVFRHRLNIADLTKGEHDMYLMGVVHACMQNPEETCRKKERARIRSTYVYHGKRVCLTAFLYLEHVTLYQMKRIRKHLQNHGVTARIHGNHGRKPSNTLPLDIYQHATYFVQNFIQQNHIKTPSSDANRKAGKNAIYRLPADFTKKTLHDEYKKYCEESMPSAKTMQYPTFTKFFKKQFPNVKFRKAEKTDRRTEESLDYSDDRLRHAKKRCKNKVVQTSTAPVESVLTGDSFRNLNVITSPKGKGSKPSNVKFVVGGKKTSAMGKSRIVEVTSTTASSTAAEQMYRSPYLIVSVDSAVNEEEVTTQFIAHETASS